MIYNRKIIGDNIGFSSVIDEKFTSCSLYVHFCTKLDISSASDRSMAIGALVYNNSTCKTYAELSEKLSSLYGSSLCASSYKRGDLHILEIDASWIADRFALDGEDISAEMTNIVCDCLFSPFAENGEINAEAFNIGHKDTLDNINAELNDKRRYTLIKVSRLAYEGEPAGISPFGTLETLADSTRATVYEASRELLRTAMIEIVYVSPKQDDRIPQMLAEKFGSIERQPVSLRFKSPSPIKPSPVIREEELDVGQSKLAVVLKSNSTDYDALYLVSLILGGTPVSKLFTNVREKLSLCYYCSCGYNEEKNAMTIDCGVERENIPKATEEIFRQLDEMRRGNISDEELASVLAVIENSYIAVGDTPGSYCSWYMSRLWEGDELTPAEKYEQFRAVSKERLAEAARSLVHDCTFHMLNKEAE